MNQFYKEELRCRKANNKILVSDIVEDDEHGINSFRQLNKKMKQTIDYINREELQKVHENMNEL
jgi:hypothetical protein